MRNLFIFFKDAVSSDEGSNTSHSNSEDSSGPGGKRRKFGISIARNTVKKEAKTAKRLNRSFSIIYDEDLPSFQDLGEVDAPSSEESKGGTGEDDEVICLTAPNYLELASSYGSSQSGSQNDDGESVIISGSSQRSQTCSTSSQT